MLKIYGKALSGEVKLLPFVKSVILRCDADTPCDMLEVVISGDMGFEVNSLEATEDGEVFFRGIVDEQIVTLEQKPTTKIIARSDEALLADNEACPDVFVNPCFELIFERYAKVCGVKSTDVSGGVYRGTLKISKGMSCFEVLDAFCKAVYK